MSSFTRMAHLDCSTKRSPTVSGKTLQLVTHLTGLKCTPLDPITDSVVNEVVLETPQRLLQTYLQGGALDIIKGDWLTVGTQDYPIKFVAPWEWRHTAFLRLVVEDRSL